MTPAATPAKSRYADGRSGAGDGIRSQAQGGTRGSKRREGYVDPSAGEDETPQAQVRVHN